MLVHDGLLYTSLNAKLIVLAIFHRIVWQAAIGLHLVCRTKEAG
jgi:hypothetical protein